MSIDFDDLRDEFRTRLPNWLEITRLNKPVGIGLLLWPTLWALWLAADGIPDLGILVIFLLGVVLTRSAGCVINDFADRDFDGHVKRTESRPMAEGRVKEKEALILFASLMGMAALLVLMLNWMTIGLAVLAAFVATLYPFTKRATHFPQLILGVAFSMGIPMAFTAQTESLPVIVWLLVIGNLLWTVAYDTEYAMVDRPWDRKVGIKSTAILFGDADKLMIGVLQAGAVVCLAMLGDRIDAGWAYWLGLAGFAAGLLWQQWLIRDRDLQACFRAFRANNLAGMAMFIGIAVDRALATPGVAAQGGG